MVMKRPIEKDEAFYPDAAQSSGVASNWRISKRLRQEVEENSVCTATANNDMVINLNMMKVPRKRPHNNNKQEIAELKRPATIRNKKKTPRMKLKNVCSDNMHINSELAIAQSYVPVKPDLNVSNSETVESNPATLFLQLQMSVAVDGLALLHPEVVEENKQRRKSIRESGNSTEGDPITDSVIETMLSQNTTAANSSEAFRRLKCAFPAWDDVVDLPEDDLSRLEEVIKIAGLSRIRAQRIHAILSTLHRERQKASFEYLRSMPDTEIKAELRRFKGLGPKTISCVLMFSLARPEFPVDTHVMRIAKSLKWVSSGATRESAYDYLNQIVPSQLKMDLHCLLVTHGRHCHNCAANHRPQFPPKDGSKLLCPLVELSKRCQQKLQQNQGMQGKTELV
mmetsp:Transcript_37179/g.42434  ORF Transcript_37179/g.42434 Transcript_37179/m.42434 type:complete len:396 (-) Transcript_37179:134-1321(-)|eukprot:CAMPEP_0194165462 /NCGR_PEP_ID=MMETSP0154-20130528/1362_1 /TAXON_ID=1049557 /ORGANISM="Thalassiothrix antarctica, Strain L6-D1" /LENGTH=395 /DNA_ID=CAMNT_0038875903 /DNA_START=29 /DNA_END=1216 /DNA_ORIENTATION=+